MEPKRLIDALAALDQFQRELFMADDILDHTDRCDDSDVSTALCEAAVLIRRAGVKANDARERLAKKGRLLSGCKS